MGYRDSEFALWLLKATGAEQNVELGNGQSGTVVKGTHRKKALCHKDL
jgi:hypothetical protein